jgi:hypothetical protein
MLGSRHVGIHQPSDPSVQQTPQAADGADHYLRLCAACRP